MKTKFWFPFNYERLGKTGSHLSCTAVGALARISAFYWHNRTLPLGDDRIARICGLGTAEWTKIRDDVVDFLNGGWLEMLDEEHAKAEAYSKKQSGRSMQKYRKMYGIDDATNDAHPTGEPRDIPRDSHARVVVDVSPSSTRITAQEEALGDTGEVTHAKVIRLPSRGDRP